MRKRWLAFGAALLFVVIAALNWWTPGYGVPIITVLALAAAMICGVIGVLRSRGLRDGPPP
jgi:hypothetical protein